MYDRGTRKQRESWLVVCPVLGAKFNTAVKEFPPSVDIRLCVGADVHKIVGVALLLERCTWYRVFCLIGAVRTYACVNKRRLQAGSCYFYSTSYCAGICFSASDSAAQS